MLVQPSWISGDWHMVRTATATYFGKPPGAWKPVHEAFYSEEFYSQAPGVSERSRRMGKSLYARWVKAYSDLLREGEQSGEPRAFDADAFKERMKRDAMMRVVLGLLPDAPLPPWGLYAGNPLAVYARGMRGARSGG